MALIYSITASLFHCPKTDDPYAIQLDRSIELIEAKRKADAEKLIRDFKEDDTLFVLNGRWGAYIAQGKVNYKIPKGTDPRSLTYADVMQIIQNDDPATNKSARAAAARTAKATKAKATKTAKPKKPAAKKPAAKKEKNKALILFYGVKPFKGGQLLLW